MKRMFVMLMLVSFTLSAQVIIDGVDINQMDDVEYCQIVGQGKFLSAKIKIIVDYGQKRTLLGEKNFAIRGKDGKKIQFFSMIQALNFMYANGWEYVDSHIVTVKSGLKGSQNVYHYILRRART